MTDGNPWVVTATVTARGPEEDLDEVRLERAGAPLQPQPRTVSAPARGGLPVVPVVRQVWPPGPGLGPQWWWVGCHGGAGVTTLIRLTGAGRDAQRGWPVLPPPAAANVVLVARTHNDGLVAASAAIRQWASGMLPAQINLLGLVLVADAPGRLPWDLREMVEDVAAGSPRLWEIHWHERLRFDPTMASLSARLPGDYRQLAADLAAISGRKVRRG